MAAFASESENWDDGKVDPGAPKPGGGGGAWGQVKRLPFFQELHFKARVLLTRIDMES